MMHHSIFIFSKALWRQFIFTCAVVLIYTASVSAQQKGMIIRIAEVDVDPAQLELYQSILKEEAEASVRLEPGVLVLFPMYQREHKEKIRILEIYASKEAYEAHLKTPHFIKYKTMTLTMVKSLRLVDMEALDAPTMSAIFSKMKQP